MRPGAALAVRSGTSPVRQCGRAGLTVNIIQRMKSRPSHEVAWSHGTSIAQQNRSQRNRSSAYERCVATDLPAACISARNRSTEPTGEPSASSSRNGRNTSSVPVTDPTSGITSTARSRPPPSFIMQRTLGVAISPCRANRYQPPASSVTYQAGKTISARAAIAGLDQTRHTLIYLAGPTTGTRGIHHQVVTALGGRPAHGSATLAAQAAGLIAAEHGERGRVPLLVIDEAHLLGHDQLEAVRILTNADMDAASPLACLLIGQPTLRRMLRPGVLAALDQRIALRYAMPAMTGEQTAGYITHHLKLAGRSDPLFSDDAITLTHDAARGLPRAVNNLATQALIAAWAGRKNIVDEQSARAAITEITTD